MCYSSQIAAAYQQYIMLTGATIDLDQLKEVYGFRHADASIRIPRVVDHARRRPEVGPLTLFHRRSTDSPRLAGFYCFSAMTRPSAFTKTR